MSQIPSPENTPLRIDVDRRGESVIVRLEGEAHMTSAAHLSQNLVNVIDQQTRKLILDLAHLAFISSTGLSAIISAYRSCQERDVDLCLAQPGPHLRDVLNVTRFDTLLPVYETIDQAVHPG